MSRSQNKSVLTQIINNQIFKQDATDVFENVIVQGDLTVENDTMIKQDLTVEGSQSVIGTQTVINVEELNVYDHKITLNFEETGSPLATDDAFIQVNRGPLTKASIMWDESDGQWKCGLAGSERPIVSWGQTVHNGVTYYDNVSKALRSNTNFVFNPVNETLNIKNILSDNLITAPYLSAAETLFSKNITMEEELYMNNKHDQSILFIREIDDLKVVSQHNDLTFDPTTYTLKTNIISASGGIISNNNVSATSFSATVSITSNGSLSAQTATISGDVVLGNKTVNRVMYVGADKKIAEDSNFTYSNNVLSVNNVTVANDIELSDKTAKGVLFINDNKHISQDGGFEYNSSSATLSVANVNTDYLIITQDISFRNDFGDTKIDPHSVLFTDSNNEIVSNENLTYDNNTLSANNVTISNDLVLSDVTANSMLFVDANNKVIGKVGVHYSEDKLLTDNIEADNVHINEDVILENKTANSVLFIDADKKIAESSGFTFSNNALSCDAIITGQTTIDNINIDGNTISSTTGDILFGGVGNVGIGTTSPAGHLHISSGIGQNGPCVVIIEADTNDHGPSETTALPRLELRQDGGFSISAISAGHNQLILANGTTSNGGLDFRTSTTSGWDTAITRMFITGVGNVGIGTTSPVAKLHILQADDGTDSFRVDDQVSDTTYFSVSDAGRVGVNCSTPTSRFQIGGYAGTVSTPAYAIHFNSDSLRNGFGVQSHVLGFNVSMNLGVLTFHKEGSRTTINGSFICNNAGNLDFGNYAATGVTESYTGTYNDIGGSVVKMRIHTNGNVGIGTGINTPSSKLQVNGTTTTTDAVINGDVTLNSKIANHVLFLNSDKKITQDAGLIYNSTTGILTATNFNTTDAMINGALNVATKLNVGTTEPHVSAKMQIDSSSMGFLPPRMTTAQRNAILSPAAGLVVFDTTINSLCVFNGSWSSMGSGSVSSFGRVPKLYYDTPPSSTELKEIGNDLANYIRFINSQVTKLSGVHVRSYAHAQGGTLAGSYLGGVYSPTQNRIYLIPYSQSNHSSWHYIDCDTGNVVGYAHGVTMISTAYQSGVYSPTQNRIYLVPFEQAKESSWHYIDCDTGNVVEYAHGVTAVNYAYRGGVYSPTQNRIYLIPTAQALQSTWHYIDCDTGNVVGYAHGVTASTSAYTGGVYSPTQNRIYLVPSGQADETTWHYIDCDTGNVVGYAHGVTAVNHAYNGGVYSPTQNRIYLVPHLQSNQSAWHYIDCDTGDVVGYTHGTTSTETYYGGVFSPLQNRIYFVPHAQADESTWHYIDCDTGGVVGYTHGVTAENLAYVGGVYSPTQNRIYLVPFQQVNLSTWNYIDVMTDTRVDRWLMAGAIFNKI